MACSDLCCWCSRQSLRIYCKLSYSSLFHCLGCWTEKISNIARISCKKSRYDNVDLSFLANQIKVYDVFTHMRQFFLAHRIRLSEILPWDRKSYLIHAILPRLSCEGFILWLYWNSSTWSSSDVIVMLKWCHHVKLHLSFSGTSGSLFWSNKKQWWARRIIHYSCEDRIEKSILWDHRLSSLSKPGDVKRWSSGWIFLSYHHTHDGFLCHIPRTNLWEG